MLLLGWILHLSHCLGAVFGPTEGKGRRSMRSKNLEFVVVPLLALGACSKNPEVAKKEFLASGDALVAQGKLSEAIVQYRNAVQQDPRFGEARLRLADTYAKQG